MNRNRSQIARPKPGLRERKKAKTRDAIQREALRLFREQGYEATTVSQIAEAAEVSESTFFRLFTTKEAVVLWDAFDPLILEAFKRQPAELSPIQALRAAFRDILARVSAAQQTELRERLQLLLSIPPVRATLLDSFGGALRLLTEAVAERAGRRPGDPAVRTLVGAVLGACVSAMFAAADDPAGNMLNVIDANAHTLTKTYDLLNRLLNLTDPLQHVTQYSYDAAGNQVGLQDAKNQVTTYTYDLRNRPVAITYPAPDAAVAFAYDVIGRRTVMTDSQGITTWTYDGVDRPVAINQPYTGTVQYTYDSAGDRLSLSYPDGKVVAYRYDLATRLAQASDWLTRTTSYLYNAIGQPLTMTLPNGVTSGYGYDSAERLSSIAHQGITQTLGSYAYTLDAVGNRVSVTETVLVPGAGISMTAIAYNYDPLYRLKSASYSTGAVFTYTYDAVGNRLTQATITNSIAYTYDTANRLVNVAGQTYTWDNNGNLLSDGVLSYAYDSANRPVTITQGANTYAFGYDGMGNRRRQLVNGVPSTYTLDLNASLVQVLTDGGGNTYLYGNGRIAQSNVSATGYFLPDALGSVRQLADTNGNVTLAKSYDPYGNVLSSAGSATSIYGFTGEVTDGTGLVYLRARFYSPATGRFFVEDSRSGNPQSPETFNTYLYGLGNPANVTDPSGNDPWWCDQSSNSTSCSTASSSADERVKHDQNQGNNVCQLLPTLCQPSFDPAPNFDQLVNTELCPVSMYPSLLPDFLAASQGLGYSGKGRMKRGDVEDLFSKIAQLLAAGGGGPKLVKDALNRICEEGDTECIQTIREFTDKLRTLANSAGNHIGWGQNLSAATIDMQNNGEIEQGTVVRGSYAYPDVTANVKEAILKALQGYSHHSERQILEPLAQWLTDNPQASGFVHLFTEREPCDESCYNMILDFAAKFQGRVDIYVYWLFTKR